MWICLHKYTSKHIYEFVKKKQIQCREESVICCNQEEQKIQRIGRKQYKNDSHKLYKIQCFKTLINGTQTNREADFSQGEKIWYLGRVSLNGL